ncbi:MAG: hypothetical protein ABFR32_12580 [Bacteroidota bacterium]
MKYLFSLLLVGMSLISIAQNRDGNMKGYNNIRGNNNFTPDQYAELQTKRLTLILELTPTQQKQVLKINQKRAIEIKKHRESIKAKRESGKTISSDEQFKMKNDRLDQMLVMQNKMKNILNADQYEQWKAMKRQKKMGSNKCMGKKYGSQRKMKR